MTVFCSLATRWSTASGVSNLLPHQSGCADCADATHPRDEKIPRWSVSEFTSDEYLVMLTRGGYIKKTELAAFSNIGRMGYFIPWKRATSSDGCDAPGLKTASLAGSLWHGDSFRTDHEQLRPLGRATRGVRAMKLRDELIGMGYPTQFNSGQLTTVEADITEEDIETEDTETEDIKLKSLAAQVSPWVLIITTGGYGKRVPVSQFKLYNRATKGRLPPSSSPVNFKTSWQPCTLSTG